MPTFTQIYYHIVFSTKDRRRVLFQEKREEFFRYVGGLIKNKNSQFYRINGAEDHIHVLTSLHPSVCLSDLVKNIKVSSTLWIRKKRIFTDFTHWQDGYGAFTCSGNERDTIIEYIKNQPEHHKKVSFQDELRKLLVDAGIEFNEKYLV